MSEQTKAYLSYLFICIIWGTTYLAIKIAVLHYPPFLMAGSRQFIAGFIMLLIGFIVRKNNNLSWVLIRQHALIGILLITLGNGLVTWAEQYIQSGVAALICSTMPISTVIINLFLGNERFSWRIFSGMLLGFLGVALIFHDHLTHQHSDHPQLFILSVVALFVATFSWAYGSILNKKISQQAAQTHGLVNSGIQVLAGGAFMLLISPFTDDFSHVHYTSPEGLFSVAYLIVFGSILAYAAYMYALKVLPVGFVTSYAYVNPLVAVLLGNYILQETLNLYTVVAFVFIVFGIFIVRSGYKKQQSVPSPKVQTQK